MTNVFNRPRTGLSRWDSTRGLLGSWTTLATSGVPSVGITYFGLKIHGLSKCSGFLWRLWKTLALARKVWRSRSTLKWWKWSKHASGDLSIHQLDSSSAVHLIINSIGAQFKFNCSGKGDIKLASDFNVPIINVLWQVSQQWSINQPVSQLEVGFYVYKKIIPGTVKHGIWRGKYMGFYQFDVN